MDNVIGNNTVDITLENFQTTIIEGSQHQVMMIEFWSPRAGDQTLQPILTKLSAQFQKHLVYARLNCDEQAEIAGQFGIQSVPTVILVKDGQPLDGFAGMQTEEQIVELLKKHLPNEEDDLIKQASDVIATGDYTAAYPLAKQAYDINPDNADAKYLFIDCQIELGQIEAAKGLLATIKLVDQDMRFATLNGKIELAEQAADSPELLALQEAHEKDPDNQQIKVDLAVQLHQAHKTEEALILLFSILQKDLNFGDAKKFALDIINSLPDGDVLKTSFRRKIYSLLY